MRLIKISSYLSVAIILFLILTPLVFVIVYGFNNVERGMIWQGFTLDWIFRVFEDQESLNSLWNSFLVATSATIISLILASSFVYGVVNYDRRYWKYFLLVPTISILSPDIAVALAQAKYFQQLDISPSLLTIALGQVPYTSGYAIILIFSSVLNKKLRFSIHAALDLGATPLRTYLSVFLPLITTSVVVSGFFIYALVFQDFIFSFHLGGSGDSTLAVRIYSMLRRGISPSINVLFMYILVAAAIGLIIMDRQNTQEVTP